MKIIIKKEADENITMKLKINSQDEKEFDYIDFIEGIYNKEEIEDPEFDESVNDWEKDTITKLIAKINGLMNANEDLE
jgi:hypothetical protein